MKKPKTLYKYTKISDYSIESINNSYLWFSSAANLNDPFDLNYRFSKEFMDQILNSSIRQVYEDLNVRLQAKGRYLPEEFYNALKNQFINDDGFKEDTMKFLRELFQHSICCFTTSDSNFLMWSHYADNHKGMCLIFDFKDESNISNYLNPVEYSGEFPIVNNVEELERIGLFRKSKHWSYEEEWRVAQMKMGKVEINSKCLKGIIFGSKCEESLVNRVLKKCKLDERSDFKIYKMIQDKYSYKLIKEEITAANI